MPWSSDSESLATQTDLLPPSCVTQSSKGPASAQNQRLCPASAGCSGSDSLTSTTGAKSHIIGSDLPCGNWRGEVTTQREGQKFPCGNIDQWQKTFSPFPSNGLFQGTDSLNGLSQVIPCGRQGHQHGDQGSCSSSMQSRRQWSAMGPALPPAPSLLFSICLCPE